MKTRLVSAILLGAGMLLISNATTQEISKKKIMPAQPASIAIQAEDIQWVDGPPSLPKGARIAILEGTPKEEGPLTMRLKFPADYKIPAHWHPVMEHLTVLEGTIYFGLGDKLDEKASKELPVGSFGMVPAKMNHFAWTKEETIVQLHSIGPWGITYVNPADDPRNQQ